MSSSSKPSGVLVTLGAPYVGKSSLIGHLLHLVHRRGTIGKGNHQFSLIVDRAKVNKGTTVQGNIEFLETPQSLLTIVDLPGTERYLGNIIAGISVGDFALLVVSAANGVLESSVSPKSMVRQQLAVAYSFRVRQIVVAVDFPPEMEAATSSQRFADATKEIETALGKVGFQPRAAVFVPVKIHSGVNLVTPPAKEDTLQWYRGWEAEHNPGERTSGVTLMSALAALRVVPPTEQQLQAPFRASVFRVFPGKEGAGVVCVCKVLAGVLKPGADVVISSSRIIAKVETLRLQGNPIDEAICGQLVTLSLPEVVREKKQIARGAVLSQYGQSPLWEVKSFMANVVVFPGYTLAAHCEHSLHFHTTNVSCILKRIISATPTKKAGKDAETVDFLPKVRLVAERYELLRPLGAFIITSNRAIIGAGAVEAVLTNPASLVMPLPPATNNSAVSFSKIPDDCWFLIMGYLDADSILSLGVTCRRLRVLSKEPHVWKQVLRGIRSFPSSPSYNHYAVCLRDKNIKKLWQFGRNSSFLKKRIAVGGLSGSGKSTLIKAICFLGDNPRADELPKDLIGPHRSDHLPVQVAAPGRWGDRERIFTELYGKRGSITRNHGQQIDIFMYCVESRFFASGKVYQHFHGLLGSGFQRKVRVVLVVTKTDLGGQSVQSITSYLRVNELLQCSFYETCKADVVSVSYNDKKSIADLLFYL